MKSTSFYYNCEFCNYATSHTSHYKRHLLSFHPNEYNSFLNNEMTTANKKQLFIVKKTDINSISHDKTSSKNESKINHDEHNITFIPSNESSKDLIRNIFDNTNHLNKSDVSLSNFNWHTNKILSCGSFSTAYLGEDINNGVKVIILQTNLDNEEDINYKKYILNKIQGLDNFPPLYDILYFGDYCYLVEGLMGFDLKTLFKLCDKKFDLITTLNIGIDVINPLTSPREVVIVFTYPYLSSGAPALGEAKGLIKSLCI